MMTSDFLLGTFLGIVEGVTEYLPISSTGHLIVAGNLVGFTGERAETFEIFIQLGAILAVVWLYWNRFTALMSGFDAKDFSGMSGRGGIIRLGIATAPALAAGFVLHRYIKEHLFSPSVVAVSLVAGGIVLLLFPDEGNQRTRSVDAVSLRQAFGIGMFQVLALCPGISRSGATIVGGMLLGCTRSAAAEFSFLLAVPTMAAAVGYDLLKSIHLLSSGDFVLFATGFAVSFVVAAAAIKSFVTFLNRSNLKLFGVYRVLFGAAVFLYFT